VTSIKLSHMSVTLSTGETIELTATVYPENATDKTITWSSSNPGVATVVDGRVTALTIGSATITAQSSNGLSATCRVTVESNPDGGGSEEIGEIEW
ncbi:MAG TPA: Ig-like domain-containing protein, partial [Candidatus Coprenecus merdipullorum]|nr:Ig-like domain-containing protein [Candidatus Coprenecus merdipullorum]